jgi:hypothetical protein
MGTLQGIPSTKPKQGPPPGNLPHHLEQIPGRPPGDPLQGTAFRGSFRAEPLNGTPPAKTLQRPPKGTPQEDTLGDPLHGIPRGHLQMIPSERPIIGYPLQGKSSTGALPVDLLQGTATMGPLQGTRSRRPHLMDTLQETPPRYSFRGPPSETTSKDPSMLPPPEEPLNQF